MKFSVELIHTNKIKQAGVYVCAAGILWNKRAMVQSDRSAGRHLSQTPKKRIHTAMAFTSFDKHLSNLKWPFVALTLGMGWVALLWWQDSTGPAPGHPVPGLWTGTPRPQHWVAKRKETANPLRQCCCAGGRCAPVLGNTLHLVCLKYIF